MYKTSIFLVNIKGWKCMFLCKFIRILICMMDKILVKTRVRKLNFYCYPVYVYIYWLCAWDTKEFLHLFSVQNFDIYQHKQDILIKLFVIDDPYAQQNICLWLAMPVFWIPLFQYTFPVINWEWPFLSALIYVHSWRSLPFSVRPV